MLLTLNSKGYVFNRCFMKSYGLHTSKRFLSINIYFAITVNTFTQS